MNTSLPSLPRDSYSPPDRGLTPVKPTWQVSVAITPQYGTPPSIPGTGPCRCSDSMTNKPLSVVSINSY
jgi:hypothetical protein